MNENIAKLLKKKKWTGAEVGRLWVYNTLYLFAMKIQGDPYPKPLISVKDLQRMINTIGSEKGEETLNHYMRIESWLHSQIQHASSCKQQAKCNLELMLKYLLCADATEKVHYYLDQLPLIVTKEQIEYQKNKVKEPFFSGEPEVSVCELFGFAIDFAISEYDKDPKSNKNLLKPLKRELQGKAITSERILKSYNRIWENGTYILPDGRTFDALTEEEWLESVKPLLDEIRLAYWDEEIGINEYVMKKHYIKNGSVQAKESLAPYLFEWQYYDDPVALDKWQLLTEGDFVHNYYEGLFSNDSDEAIETLETFMEEYPELYSVILFYIKQHFEDIGALDIKAWGNPLISWKDIYGCSFAGFKEENFDDPLVIWDGNYRALHNGLAVYQPLPYTNDQFLTATNGHFEFPSIDEIYAELSPFMLSAFFSDSEFYEHTVGDIYGARESFLQGYKRVVAYNKLLDMMASKYKIDGLDIVKMKLNDIDEKITTFNFICKRLYKSISNCSLLWI